MQFCVPNDFIDPPYMIPNQQESAGGISNFKEKIADFEKDILKDLFGYELYLQLIAGLSTSGTPEAIWTNLKNGTSYRLCADGPRFEWVGLKKMLIPAIHSKFQPILHRRAHQNGVVVNLGQNNTTIEVPIYEVVTSWNDYCKIAGSHCDLDNTLAGFFQANEASYPDFVFCSPQRQNQFNL